MESSADSGDELTVQQAFELARSVQQQGYLENADKIYLKVLEVAPDHLDALHFMALGRSRMGRRAEAIEMVRHVVAHDPSNIHARNNLGNLLMEAGQLEEARALYEQVVAQDARFPAGHANLGAVLRKQGDTVGAQSAFRQALALDPKHVSAMHNLGSLLWDLDRILEALTFYQQALVLMPYDGESYRRVGASLAVLGRIEEAIAVFDKWLKLEPNNELARHMLAACSGRDVPTRASDTYVADTFDMFADSFDKVLGNLGYQAPALVAGAVATALGPAEATRDVLDAGAGTGLCGPSLRTYAKHLVGVDLSAKMLEKARARGLYDEIVTGELTAFMAARPGAFDLVASADTLCYFGELDEVLAAAWSALRPGGHLIFTVERTPPELETAHRLNPHGRYSHSDVYVRGALQGTGFTAVKLERVTLRLENMKPVEGLLVTARRGDAVR